MLEYSCMKRILITLVFLALTHTPAHSAVVNVDLEDIIKIGLTQNQDIKNFDKKIKKVSKKVLT